MLGQFMRKLQGIHSQIPVNAATNDCNYLPHTLTHTTHTCTHTCTHSNRHIQRQGELLCLAACLLTDLLVYFSARLLARVAMGRGLHGRRDGGRGEAAKHVRYMRTCYFLPSWGPGEFWQLVIGSSPAVRCLSLSLPSSPSLSLSLYLSLSTGQGKKN